MSKSQREERIEELKSLISDARIFNNTSKITTLTAELTKLENVGGNMNNDEVEKARTESIYDSNFCPALQ